MKLHILSLALLGAAFAVVVGANADDEPSVRALFVPVCPPTPSPEPLTELAAAPADGSVALSWRAPANSACVNYYYNITYAAMGPTGEVGTLETRQVGAPEATLSGLANGILYKFMVRAGSRELTAAAAEGATVAAVPGGWCDPAAAPGAPSALAATSGSTGAVRLCWGAPAAGGCVSEYRLALKQVPLTDEEVKASRWTTKSLRTAGCMTVPGLAEGRGYQFAVQAWSAGAKAGANAGAEVTVAREWRCMPVSNWYSLCSAASEGRCNPQSCSEQAKRGMCGAPWMRQYEPSTKTVVQYCGDFCRCGGDESGPGGEAVVKMDGPPPQEQQGGYDGDAGCCKP